MNDHLKTKGPTLPGLSSLASSYLISVAQPNAFRCNAHGIPCDPSGIGGGVPISKAHPLFLELRFGHLDVPSSLK